MESSWPGDWTGISCLFVFCVADGFFTLSHWGSPACCRGLVKISFPSVEKKEFAVPLLGFFRVICGDSKWRQPERPKPVSQKVKANPLEEEDGQSCEREWGEESAQPGGKGRAGGASGALGMSGFGGSGEKGRGRGASGVGTRGKSGGLERRDGAEGRLLWGWGGNRGSGEKGRGGGPSGALGTWGFSGERKRHLKGLEGHCVLPCIVKHLYYVFKNHCVSKKDHSSSFSLIYFYILRWQHCPGKFTSIQTTARHLSAYSLFWL